jgi:SAM-dependent methyltransferase
VSEFTGERVIPGQVEVDLWAEHAARYAFAARFARDKRVLDLGCGTGYGTAALAEVARECTGIDNAPEAIEYASTHYSGAAFLLQPATQLPFAGGSFDLITAFELIEHLPDWPRMLTEARRVLDPNGLLMVSTPNKIYYAEARGEAGPNPYHAHEFEYEEFRTALNGVFPHVRILLQDRLEAFAFYQGGDARTEACLAAARRDPQAANFFVALCSSAPIPPLPAFVFVPEAANLLRQRERHIRLLEAELAQVRAWLEQTTSARDQLLAEHEALQQHLEERNQWARGLESDLHAAQQHLKTMQAEQERAAAIIEDLNRENRAKTEWALETERRLTTELAGRDAQLEAAVKRLDEAEATVVERTQWAQRLDERVRQLDALLARLRQSRWIKLGRRIGLGPQL